MTFKLIAPAIVSLLSATGFALAQTSPEAASSEAGAAEEASPAETGPKAAQSEGSEAPLAQTVEEKARIAPRTEEQAAIARKIASTAPARKWPKIPSNPAREKTVMFPQDAKKISDVSIIASVDQQNKLELLDITGGSTSDNLQVRTTSFTGPGEGQAQAAANPTPGEGEEQAQGEAAAGNPEKIPTLDSLADEQASSPNK